MNFSWDRRCKKVTGQKEWNKNKKKWLFFPFLLKKWYTRKEEKEPENTTEQAYEKWKQMEEINNFLYK